MKYPPSPERPEHEEVNQSGAATKTVGFALAAHIATMVPVFLQGALFPLIRDDFGIGAAELGQVTAVYFATSALSSIFLARYSDRIGPWRMARLVQVAIAVICIALSFSAGALQIVFLMSLAGLANGCIQPATNVAVSRAVSVDRQGLAFGLKQAAVPVAALLAGLAAPLISTTWGWRASYLVASILPICMAFALPREDVTSTSSGSRTPEQGNSWSTQTLMLFCLMVGLGSATANSMVAFLVTALVGQGFEYGSAGKLMAIGSFVSIGARICFGVAADRYRLLIFPTIGCLFAGGAVAYWIFSLGGAQELAALATLMSFGMGFGWAGLSILAVVRANHGSPGRSTGIVHAGVFVGAVVGPLSFGWIASAVNFDAAWMMLGVAASVAALIPFMLLAQGVPDPSLIRRAR